MFKNWLRYCLPAIIVLLAALGISIATTIQSWPNASGTTVATIDSNGGYTVSTGSGSVNFNSVFSTSNSASTAAITSSGAFTITEPFAGTAYKKVILGITALTTTAAITFTYPTAFTVTPITVANTMSAGSIGTFTSAAGGGTIATSGTVATGFIILEGQ